MGEWGWKDARLAEANFPLEETVCKIIIYGLLCENDDLPPPCRELGNGTAPGRPACRHCTFPAAGLLGGEAEAVNTQAAGWASRTRLQHLPQAGTHGHVPSVALHAEEHIPMAERETNN